MKEFNFKLWMVWQLRRASYRWPGRSKGFAQYRVERGVYKCNSCKDHFGSKEVQLDHITPIVDPSVGFTTWDEYISRMFCGPEGLQVLCKPCHKIKTKGENNVRNNFKSKSKRPVREKSTRVKQKKKSKKI